MINKYKKSLPAGRQGFTLIETLVAVFILSVSIAGPLTIASQALTSALVAKDQITAFYLAQDAIEYVRFVRDTNKLSGGDWLTGAGGSGTGLTDLTPCVGATGCYLDSTGNFPATPSACVSGGCIQPTFSSSRFMCYDTPNNRFGYIANTTCTGTSGVTKTIFARWVTITAVGVTGTEVRVTASVAWSDTGGVVRYVTINENIFNWQ